jgi:hyperosmotically inducible periplasmic protein
MRLAFGSLICRILVGGILFSGCVIATAQDPAQTTAPQPDNTKVNERDRNASQATADQEKENRSDRDITQQIRKAIVGDKSLSMYAHNVKIVTQNGMVTLKGPVRSEDEKKAVEEKAAAVAGDGNVSSQLDVKPKQ